MTRQAKKLSILGLVLVAASAVTAAMMPSKAKSEAKDVAKDGVLVDSTNGGVSCTNGIAGAECTDTATAGALSSTTRNGQNTSVLDITSNAANHTTT